MKLRQHFILALLLMMTQGAWGTTVYVATYAELKAAIENASVDNIIVTANIDVPCETSVTSTSNPDYNGSATAQLVIGRSLTLQSQAGSKYTIKRVSASGQTSNILKSIISIRGSGNGDSGSANLTENEVEVTFTNIIIDGGADWGSSTVEERRSAASDAYGNSGRAMIDIFLGGTLNLEDGVVLQNGYTTYSINSVVNDSGSSYYGGAVRVEYHASYGGGTINVKAGATIHDCTARAGYGGGLGAYNHARLNLYGGTIYNCSALHGGAIGCTWRNGSDHKTSGTVNMYGGTIHDCCAGYGGAINMDGEVSNYILGGSIENCSASSNGSAICIPEAGTSVNIVAYTSHLLTISNCTGGTSTSTDNTGGYEGVYKNENATIAEYPVYHVTFRNNNTVFAVLSVAQGTSLGEAFPAAPVNASFRFVGWFDGDTQITSSTVITDNITVTARWDFLGSGTSTDPYLIKSADVWDFLADNVNNGNAYSDQHFQLTNDISVTTMAGAGTSDGNFKSFNGTFDGNRKTLDVSISGTGSWTALFGALNGATIKNLHITGSISTDGVRVASIAGFISGNTTIENCWSEVAISSSQANNWVDAGAFVARINSGNTLTLNGCLFTGSITYSDENAYEGGGMVGWAQYNTIAKFYDCVFAPSAISITNYQDEYMFVASYEGYVTRTIDNCYYNDVANATSMTKEGKHGHSITAGDDVTISGLGSATATYNVSGITVYDHGILCNGTYYAGNGDAVSLNLNHADKNGYTFSQYTVTGGGLLDDATSNTPTLTMTDADQTIGAVWTRNMVTLTDGVDLSASGLTSYMGKQCDVSYSRLFTEGKASTMCLPFAYTKKVGDGSFYAFTGIEKVGSNYIATMTEPSTTTLTANTPYLYMPSATGSVDFGGTYTIPAELTAGSTTNGDWTYQGTYTTVEWPEAPTGIYGFSAQDVDAQGISQGQFVKVGAYVRVKPMRCYLKYKSGSADYAGARGMNRATADEPLPETISVRLVSADGEVSAIGTLHTETGEVTLDGWYTLDGTRLSGQPTRKGIYVNKGKKVVIE